MIYLPSFDTIDKCAASAGSPGGETREREQALAGVEGAQPDI